jgi:hypothetical protein
MVKSSGGQRESEGPIVVRIGVQLKAPGAKGPRFDRACVGSERQDMSARLMQSNHPGGRRPAEPAARESRRLVGWFRWLSQGAGYGYRPSGHRSRCGAPNGPVSVTPGGRRRHLVVRRLRCRASARKIIGKSCAGKPHARIERGIWKRARVSGRRASDYQWADQRRS